MSRVKKSFRLWLPNLVFVAVCAALPNAVWADVSYSGSISPATSPTTWTSTDAAVVGYSGTSGTVTVTQGASSPTAIQSASLTVGNVANKNGSVVTINGSGSSWTMPSTGGLTICSSAANNSSASMDITNGAAFTGGGVTLGAGTHTNATLTVGGVSNGIHATANFAGGMTVGYGGSATGNVNILAGGIVNCNQAALGPSTASANANGNVTVDYVGSQWNITGAGGPDTLSVGATSSTNYYGNLYITNGAAVTADGATWVGAGWISQYGYANGYIYFGNGGSLTTKSLACNPGSIVSLSGPGFGTINTRGLVTDMALKFDATHGLIQTRPSPATGVRHSAMFR